MKTTIRTLTRMTGILAILLWGGCVDLFDDENPAGPQDEPIVWYPPHDEGPSDSTGSDSSTSDPFTIFNVPFKMLYTPYHSLYWSPLNGHDLYSIDPGTGTIGHVLSRAANDMGFDWISLSPDNTRFLFWAADSVPIPGGWTLTFVLHEASINGEIIGDRMVPGYIEWAVLATDGRMLYKAGDPAAGDEIRIDNSLLFFSPYVLTGTPAWAPSENEVIVSVMPMDPANPDYGNGIYTINISDGIAAPIVTASSSFLASESPVSHFYGVSVSRGRVLFFTLHDDMYAIAWTSNPDGSEVKKIYKTYNHEIFNARFAADNRYLVFGDFGRNGIFMVNIEDGTEEKMLEPYGKFAVFN